MLDRRVVEDPASFAHLPAKDVRPHFAAALETMSRRFFKLETRDYYPTDEGESLEKFRAGDIDGSRQALAKHFGSSEPSAGVAQVRLRAVGNPPSEYERWQLQVAYDLIESTGEEIFVLGRDEEVAELFDFVIVDDRLLIVQDFDEKGNFSGGWVTSQPETIAKFADEFAQIKSRATPLREYIATSGLNS